MKWHMSFYAFYWEISTRRNLMHDSLRRPPRPRFPLSHLLLYPKFCVLYALNKCPKPFVSSASQSGLDSSTLLENTSKPMIMEEVLMRTPQLKTYDFVLKVSILNSEMLSKFTHFITYQMEFFRFVYNFDVLYLGGFQAKN